MPRIKRYGPLAHGFNRDPQIRELRKRYADWMGYVWQEMCLIGDLNGGEIKGTAQEIGESLAYISLRKRPSIAAKVIRNSLTFMQVSGWIRILSDRVLILNYKKYHPFENDSGVPTNELNELNEHLKIQDPASPAPSADPSSLLKLIQKWEVKMASMNLIPELKEIADTVYFSDPVKFKCLAAWIAQGRKRDHRETDMAETLRRFDKKDRELVDDWYPYLDSILVKVEADRSRDSSLVDHERHKAEVREASKMFLVK